MHPPPPLGNCQVVSVGCGPAALAARARVPGTYESQVTGVGRLIHHREIARASRGAEEASPHSAPVECPSVRDL